MNTECFMQKRDRKPQAHNLTQYRKNTVTYRIV